jgi:hypothetical protein
MKTKTAVNNTTATVSDCRSVPQGKPMTESSVNDKTTVESMAGFANLIISHCREKYGETDLEFDPNKGVVRHLSGKGCLHLRNLFAHFSIAEKDARSSLLAQFAEILMNLHLQPSTFLEAKDRLIPVIKNRWMEGLIFQVPSNEDRKPTVVQQFTDNLVVEVVYDHPSFVSFINTGTIEEWGVDADTLFATALENLKKSYKHRRTQSANNSLSLKALGFKEVEGCRGLYTDLDDDWFCPARILIPEWIRSLDVSGDPVVMVSHCGHILVTGSDNANGLLMMATMTMKIREMEGAVSTIPIRLTPQGWQAYQPDPAHPAYPLLKELYTVEIAGCYHHQKQIIEPNYPGFVATCSVCGLEGTAMTTCVWGGNGLTGILPKTDFVAFISGYVAKGTSGGVLLFVPWDAVAEIVGHHLQPTAYSPPRFHFSGFPSDEEMDLLAKRIPQRIAEDLKRRLAKGVNQ